MLTSPQKRSSTNTPKPNDRPAAASRSRAAQRDANALRLTVGSNWGSGRRGSHGVQPCLVALPDLAPRREVLGHERPQHHPARRTGGAVTGSSGGPTGAASRRTGHAWDGHRGDGPTGDGTNVATPNCRRRMIASDGAARGDDEVDAVVAQRRIVDAVGTPFGRQRAEQVLEVVAIDRDRLGDVVAALLDEREVPAPRRRPTVNRLASMSAGCSLTWSSRRSETSPRALVRLDRAGRVVLGELAGGERPRAIGVEGAPLTTSLDHDASSSRPRR